MTHCRYVYSTHKGSHSSFLTPTVVGGRRPFSLKYSPAHADFGRFPLTSITSEIAKSSCSCDEYKVDYELSNKLNRGCVYATLSTERVAQMANCFILQIEVKLNRAKSAKKSQCVKTSSGNVA